MVPWCHWFYLLDIDGRTLRSFDESSSHERAAREMVWTGRASSGKPENWGPLTQTQSELRMPQPEKYGYTPLPIPSPDASNVAQ
jgi:hypothetical protein